MSALDSRARRLSPRELRRKLLLTQWGTGLMLCLLGLLLEVVYLALYPWLDGHEQTPAQAQHDVVRHAWKSLLPWLTRAYQQVDWTGYALHVYQWPAYLRGQLYPLLLLLVLGLLLVLAAVSIGARGDRVLHVHLPAGRPLFVIIFVLACVFGLTMLVAPLHANIFAQDMFLSGLDGRMVVSYHLNPYVAHSALLKHDTLQQALAELTSGTHYAAPPFGPVWIDISILIALIPHMDVAATVLCFRIIALVVYLATVLLLWSLLAALRPWQRISMTLLYAWNPLVLLLGIAMVHQELLVILLLLLSFSSVQRNATILSWVFVLLAALMDLSCLLILPLFFVWFVRQTRFMAWSARILWFLGMLLVTALVLLLAYIPYWQGWNVMGMLLNVRQIFWQESAVNSLNAAILALPLHLPAQVVLYIQPSFWSLAVLGLLACYLLFALWLADTLELVLQCCGWLLLIGLVLMPVYWPWYLLVPLIFVVCAGKRGLLLCAVLLTVGALFCLYFWQWHRIWPVEGLLILGIPCLLWGWVLFFTTSARMLARRDRQQQGVFEDEENDEDELDDATHYVYNDPWNVRPAVVMRPTLRASRRDLTD